jgi:hypothetical protein
MSKTPTGPRKRQNNAPAPPSSKPSGSDARKIKRHQNRRKAKARKTKADVIDMTEETDDDLDSDAPKFFSGLTEKPSQASASTSTPKGPKREANKAGPSKSTASSSIKGKERASPEVPVQSQPSEPEQAVSSFKPLTRSIMSGWKLSMSRSPSPPRKRARTDSPQVEIFIDEKPAAGPSSPGQAAEQEQFDPPGLFSTSLIPSKKTKRTLRREDAKQQDALAVGKSEASAGKEGAPGEETLLLPSHVMLASTGDDVDIADAGDQPMNDSDGVHIVDDSKAKVSYRWDDIIALLTDEGVQRYFDPEAGTDDVSTFLASADQSRMCMNCKRPGHNQRDCPHVIECR